MRMLSLARVKAVTIIFYEFLLRHKIFASRRICFITSISLRCTLMVPGFASTRSASRMKFCASLPKSVGILRIGLAIVYNYLFVCKISFCGLSAGMYECSEYLARHLPPMPRALYEYTPSAWQIYIINNINANFSSKSFHFLPTFPLFFLDLPPQFFIFIPQFCHLHPSIRPLKC